jgi:predicted XRE-type DNA-binding protein
MVHDLRRSAVRNMFRAGLPDSRVPQAAKGNAEVSGTSKEPIEVVRGSGNVFRDFNYPDADVRQAKAIMGAQIIKILDRERLSTRQAEAATGISHSEFSRIRQASFSRFTIDRLMTILYRFGQEVEISVKVHPRKRPKSAAEVAVAHP